MVGLIKDTVRKLRRDQTESEKVIWDMIRNRQLMGKKFLRQHPINFKYQGKWRFYVADFYCAELKLVVEIDGEIHRGQKDYDEMRTVIINQLGMKVVRVKNEDVGEFRENCSGHDLVKTLTPGFFLY